MGDETNTTSKNVAKRLLKGSGNIYRIEITNAAYSNRVITDVNAPPGTGNAPIFGITEIGDDTQVVRIRSFYPTLLSLC